MQESDRLHAIDLQRLLERSSAFVEVPCPACNDERRTPLWDKDGFKYVLCSACGTAYLSPRPPPTLLDEYYKTAENYVFWSRHIFPASDAARREHIARPRVVRLVDIARRHGLSPGGTLVEVGAGHGTFCEEAASNAFFGRVVAIEPTPSNAESCRKARGVEVIEEPIEAVQLGTIAADVVASFEVIEHLFAPAAFVSACAKALRPGGLLVLSCPNLHGFEVATLQTASRTVDPEHLNYFHPTSLRALLTRCGLEVVELLTPGRLDAEIVRKRALAGDFELRDPFVEEILLRRWTELGGPFQDFLANNMLSAHMWAVARRPSSSEAES
ncbi:MAG: hypothetical protein BGO98_48720 [Myxococcales bacterium 68-20]|nr:MAG: hypothetical protein BGO98_48720 [Myxococcales bacterium 68-20]